MHFIPNYSAWLNQVEQFFALITDKAIRRGSFTSVKQRKTYVMELSLVSEVSLVKAWKADECGNLAFRRTARNFNPAVAMAGKVTVAEVEEIVANGALDPDAIHLPGIYVHRIVGHANPEKGIERRTLIRRKELDVAIRVGELGDSSLLAQRVGTTHRAVVASRALAAQLSEQHCLPAQPADLAQHNCIVYTGLATRNQWAFDAIGDSPTVSVPVQGRLSRNSSEVVRDAVLAGLALGFSPTWLFSAELKNGDVVRLMPQFSPHPLPVDAIYSPSRRHSSKVSAFVQKEREGLTGMG